MDILAMQMEENARTIKLTLLFRPGGVWHNTEVDRLVNGLVTETSQHPKHPSHIVLFGHFTKAQTLEALLGGVAYTATQITGIAHKELPFRPGFM